MDREQRMLVRMGVLMLAIGAIFMVIAALRSRDLGGPSGTVVVGVFALALGGLTPRRKRK